MKNNIKKKERIIRYLTKKYLIVIRNKGNFEVKRKLSFNLAQVFFYAGLVFTLTFAVALLATKTFLGFWFDPSYINLENKKRLIDLSISLDSLENEIKKKDLFIHNFQNIVKGDLEYVAEIKKLDLNKNISKTKNKSQLRKLLALSPSEEKLRKEFKNVDINNLNDEQASLEELQNLFLFKPVEGFISSPFDPSIEHFGIDIVTKKDETVKSVLNGTVILAAWTQEAGYVVSVQHEGNLMSVYKHNEALKVKLGQRVTTGQLLAVVGNSGELSSGPHLHFELWHKGMAVNPTQFIDL